MAATWRIRVGVALNKPDPLYIWEIGAEREWLPLKAVWTWDDAGTIWSTGSTARYLRATLSQGSDWLANHPNSSRIRWLTRYNDFGGQGKKYMLDYPACKMSKGASDSDVTYHNLIRHIAMVKITFSHAAKYLGEATFNVMVEDYLNYFYLNLEDFLPDQEGAHPFLFPLDTKGNSQITLTAKDINWRGKWLLWHSRRLEADEFEWEVPPTAGNGPEYTRVAVTVLSGMPGRGITGKDPYAGNKDKGRGMASTFGGTDYEPRGPIPVPMFMGPGTIKIEAIDHEVIGRVHDSDTAASIKPNLDEVKNKEIPVQSILKDFENSHEWPLKEWEAQQGLISERAYNEGGTEYYEGQIPHDSPATYVVNKIEINPAWLAEAQESGTKCAIVFVMAYGEKEVYFKYFVDLYSHSTIPQSNFIPQVIVDTANVFAAQPGEIVNGTPAFAFKEDYRYIIDPDDAEGDTPEMVFNSHDFTATVPGLSTHYQFIAMIYRIVPDDDPDHQADYIIDPECPYPIEYWYGVTTPKTGGGWSRLGPPQLCTTAARPTNTSPQQQQTTQSGDSGVNAKTSVNRADDNTSTVSGSIDVTNTTHVRVRVIVPSTTDARDLPPTGSYIRFYLHDIAEDEDIWSDAMIRLPTTAGGTVSREILFLVRQYTEGKKYQIYRQLYESTGEKIGAPRAVGLPYLTGTREHLIDSLTMNVVFNAPNYVVQMSDLEMLYAPKEASYYYSFTIRSLDVLPAQTYTATLTEPCHPSEFAWNVTLKPENIQLADSTKYELILSIRSGSQQGPLLASYNWLYITKHYITSFTAEDVFAQEHPDEQQFFDEDKEVKVQFRFHATTLLPPSSTTYIGKVCLYEYADERDQPDTEPPQPAPVRVWVFPDAYVTDEFEVVVDEPIRLSYDPGTYRLSLQLINAATEAEREIYYTAWETPQRMASGWIIGGGKRIRIRTPALFPDEQHIEYRMLRDGVLGTVESPWEMRTESVIGGNTVTQPAWIVRPRMVQFRVLVTAPADLMPQALQTLNEVLVSAPTKGVELRLQTTDLMRQLSIFGYIQVGSPKIEIREGTLSIVSVALDCPNYAWKGHREIIQLNWNHTYEFTPIGHHPPAVDIWILKNTTAVSIELVINGNKPLKIAPGDTSYNYIHVHHNPIVQEYYIEIAKTLPPTIPDPDNTGRSCIVRSHPPLSAHSIVLGDEETNIIETQRMFELIQADSYLPLILNPSQPNTIKVTGGRLRLIEYVPHYAFWW